MKRMIALFPLLLVLYETAVYLSNDMYVPALPEIMRDFGTTHYLSQLTVTTWFLGAFSMQFLLGPISDRYGRRPVVLGGGLLFLISSLVCALSANIIILLIARFFQGMIICSVTVAGYAAIHEMLESKEAIRTIATMNSITVLAPAFGPLLGGLVLTLGSWRLIFWVLTIWGAIAISALFKQMPETRPYNKESSLNMVAVFKAYGRILSTSQFTVNSLAFCLLFSAMIAWIAAGPFLVITKFNYSPIIFGVIQACVFGSFIVGARMTAHFIEKVPVAKIINIGLALVLCGGLFNILSTAIYPQSLALFVVFLMLFAAGAGINFAPLSRLAVEGSKEAMGATMAVFSTLMSLFGAVGSGFVSGFYNETLLPLASMTAAVGILACIIKWWNAKSNCQAKLS